ncbi:MAG: hypothetical protein MJZ52_05690 [Bacteroidales bacterium]|nr:hypothetical protein [Bacteroidales bacterium]
MRQKGFFLVLLALIVVASGCAPKIIGKRKHKKIHGCGCEWLPSPIQAGDSSNCITFYQTDNLSLNHFDGQNASAYAIRESNKN